MASVQELLLAAEAKKKPNSLLELLQSGVQGFQTGQGIRKTNSDINESNVDIAIKLIQKQALEKEMAQREQTQNLLRQELIGREQDTTNDFKSTGVQPKPVMPDMKLKKKISVDPKGDLSATFETVTPKEPDVPTSLDSLLTEKVRNNELTIEQALRMKDKPPAPDKTMQREVAKAKVDYAKYKPIVDTAAKEIDRILPLNENSYGGKIGQAKMAVKSALEFGTEDPKFTNTADVINTMQGQVVKVLKSSFGGQLSDGEREYLNKVYGALPGMSRSERKIAMTNVKRMLQASLDGKRETLVELLDDAGIDSSLLDVNSQAAQNQEETGGLSPEEQKELDELEAEFGGGK